MVRGDGPVGRPQLQRLRLQVLPQEPRQDDPQARQATGPEVDLRSLPFVSRRRYHPEHRESPHLRVGEGPGPHRNHVDPRAPHEVAIDVVRQVVLRATAEGPEERDEVLLEPAGVGNLPQKEVPPRLLSVSCRDLLGLAQVVHKLLVHPMPEDAPRDGGAEADKPAAVVHASHVARAPWVEQLVGEAPLKAAEQRLAGGAEPSLLQAVLNASGGRITGPDMACRGALPKPPEDEGRDDVADLKWAFCLAKGAVAWPFRHEAGRVTDRPGSGDYGKGRSLL